MDFKELEKELRTADVPFEKKLEVNGDTLIAQINDKREITVISYGDEDKYKYKYNVCTLTDNQLKEIKWDLVRLAAKDEEKYEELLNACLRQNTVTKYSSKFPNIKQFILMLKKVSDEKNSMEEIINSLLNKIEILEIKSEFYDELKSDILRELKRKPTVDNSYLWASIREIAKFLEEYVG